MSRINRPPIGLQYVMGNTNFGDNPSELSGITAPVVDLMPFFGVELIDFEYNSANVSSGAGATRIEVPENELWLVKQIVGFIASAPTPGDTASISLFLENPIRKNPLIAPAIDYCLAVGETCTFATIPDDCGCAVQFPELLPVPSGVTIKARPGNMVLTTGVVALDLHVMFYRIKV